MLLELKNTNADSIEKLMSFAKDNGIQLSLIDEDSNNYHLPGKPLTPEQLEKLIEKSRKSGVIEMSVAHSLIRQSLNANKL